MMIRLGQTPLAVMSKVCRPGLWQSMLKVCRVEKRLSKMIAAYYGSFEYIS
jgi:hypothetical protein